MKHRRTPGEGEALTAVPPRKHTRRSSAIMLKFRDDSTRRTRKDLRASVTRKTASIVAYDKGSGDGGGIKERRIAYQCAQRALFKYYDPRSPQRERSAVLAYVIAR